MITQPWPLFAVVDGQGYVVVGWDDDQDPVLACLTRAEDVRTGLKAQFFTSEDAARRCQGGWI